MLLARCVATRDEMGRNVVKSHFMRFDFQKTFNSIDVLCVLRRLFVRLSFLFVLSSFDCSFFCYSFGIRESNTTATATATATATSTMAVSGFVIVLCSLRCSRRFCRSFWNYLLLFGRRASVCTFDRPPACSVALCSGFLPLYTRLAAHFSAVHSVFIAFAGDICLLFSPIKVSKCIKA